MNAELPKGWTLMRNKRTGRYSPRSPGRNGVRFDCVVPGKWNGGTRKQAIAYAQQLAREQAADERRDQEWEVVK